MENKLKTMILYFMALFTNLDNSISSFSTKKKKEGAISIKSYLMSLITNL